MSKDHIIQRIKKLLKHAESAKELGSKEEAQAFAGKANELLMEHNLSMLDVAQSAEGDAFSEYVYGEKISYKDNQSGSRWKFELITVLTYFNLCNFTFNRGLKTFRVYGKMQNVDVVVWMYNFLSIGLLRLAQEAHVNMDPMMKVMYSNRYAFLKDFLLGAVVGIRRKLQAQRDEMAKSSQFNALMVVTDKQLGAFIGKAAPDVKENTREAKTIMVGPAHSLGVKAGEKFNITSPLANSTTKESKKLGHGNS